MKLSTAVEQACCILALLACSKNKEAITNETLAKYMGVSPTYLTKITRRLVIAGLIVSVPGVKGGFAFGRSWEDITLDDVVVAVDGNASFFQSQGIIERVFSDKEQKVERGMSVVERGFHDAQNEWNTTLRKITLAAVVKEVTRG